jgi:cobalt/nickel transport system ATP-binding protein
MAVRVHALSHSFPCGRRAVDGVSFTVAAGECVALLGANGAGKTTLLLRLAGLLAGKAGEATVAELDPAADARLLPARVGVVFQNPDDQLFCPTLREDAMFGPLQLGVPAKEAERRAEDALARVGLAGQGHRGPGTLSGGEKRRAAVAGVMTMQPAVWLLDEPTMFLDPRGRREFAALLNELPGTKVVATHDLDLARACCARSLLLAGGRLEYDGPTAALLDAPERLLAAGL